MLVATLIEKLKEFPPHLEVYLDCSSPNSTYFTFAQPQTLEEGEINEGDGMVLIISASEFSDEPPFENMN